ncbi:hypothetical protein V5F59_05585 [Xanthobacter autotrophicus DSM 431]|uniref:hypothetical protein n=1 Tax=Xanthobacter nonsaccharivorans TaxID=3119912 RepID=UPI00372976E1
MTNTSFRRRIALWSPRALLSLVVLAASPALALDPVPKGYREKQRHDFRDVQLGLSHSSGSDRSVPNGGTIPPAAPADAAGKADDRSKRIKQ